MSSFKFQKMWGAHPMGAGVAEQVIAYNFLNDPALKEKCGVVEKHAIFCLGNERGTEFYYETSEMEEAANFGFDRFTDKEKTDKYISDCREFVRLADDLYLEFLKEDLAKKSVGDLLEMYENTLKVYARVYAIYHACQPQYVSKIETYVKEKLESQLGSTAAEEAYSLLTLSEELDPLSIEEIEWLEIVKEIRSKYPESLESSKESLPKDLFEKIEKHSQRYIYLGTVETNNPWDLNFYLKKLQDDIKSDPSEKIAEIRSRKEALAKKKEELAKELDKEVITICENLAKIGLIRLVVRLGWTKSAYISIEISKQMLLKADDKKLNSETILQYTLKERKDAFLNKIYLSEEEIVDRSKAYLFYSKDLINDTLDKVEFYVGENALSKKKELIEEENLSLKEFSGSIACKGKITGRVKLFIWGEDKLAEKMDEMVKGDVLVAGQTRPFLMPAIKKAAAIVTDEGGITSHAAIVSRELSIPCVIGTKIATKILKDGDLIEVDANTGVVKILEK